MNLQKLSLRNAGPFEHAEFRFRAPVTFLVGENESGKSTLKEWISGFLFGFSGKRALRASLIRWGEKEAVVSGELVLQGERVLRAERRVRENAAGCLVEMDGQAQELGDVPLPPLGDMDRDLYASVYSLRVEDLHFPDASAWTALQSRLLSGEIAAFLRPVSEVSAQWKNDALKIWRPDRRGNPTLSDHLDRKQHLVRCLEEAEDRQALLKRLTVEEEEMRETLDSDASELVRTEAFLEEGRAQQALLQDWQRYRRLLDQAGDLAPYAELPRDLPEHWQRMAQADSELRKSLQEARGEHETRTADRDAFTEKEQRILARREDIRTLAGSLARYNEDTEDLRRLKSVRAETAGSLRRVAESVLKDPDQDLSILSGISTARLEDGVHAYASALDRERETENSVKRLEEANVHNRMALWGLLPAGFMLAAGVFLLIRPQALPQGSLIGGGLIAAALILGALSVGAGLPRFRSHLRLMQKEERSDRRRLESARQQLEDCLGGLSVADRLWEDPRELLRQVETLRREQEKFRDSQERIDGLEERIEGFNLDAEFLSKGLLDAPGTDAASVCVALTDALERAMRVREKADLSAQELEKTDERLERLLAQQEKSGAQRQYYLALLSTLPGANPEDRVEELQRRRRLAERARSIADEVYERTGTDLSAFGEKAASEPWPWDDQSMLEAREKVQRIRERRDEVRSRLGAITEERKALIDQPSPSDIQSEIDREDETIRRLTRERDQVALAFGLLRLGEEAWRREHQPELIQRAGDYLGLITHGKYTRLFLPEGGKNLYVYYEKSESYLDPVERRLSKGTLEQIYLALRLAMLDQLDPQGEPLPLLLDETLVNWDDRRTEGLRTILENLSGRRQVLFFSCHPETAQKLGGDNAEIIRMEEARLA